MNCPTDKGERVTRAFATHPPIMPNFSTNSNQISSLKNTLKHCNTELTGFKDSNKIEWISVDEAQAIVQLNQ